MSAAPFASLGRGTIAAMSTTMAARYDRAAVRYQRWWAPVLRPSALSLLDVVAPWVRADGPTAALDVGSGTGVLAIEMVRRWPRIEVTAIDASGGMLDVARAEADRLLEPAERRRIRFEVALADRLPFEDERFDLVVSSFVFQLVPNRFRALREARRVLRPGGRLAYVTWLVHDDRFRPDDALEAALDEVGIEPPADAEEDRSGDLPSPEAAVGQLRRAGFRDVRAWQSLLVHRWSAVEYLDFLEHYGEHDLFLGLEPSERAQLRLAIATRFAALSPDDFAWRAPIVTAVGRRPEAARGTRRRPSTETPGG